MTTIRDVQDRLPVGTVALEQKQKVEYLASSPAPDGEVTLNEVSPTSTAVESAALEKTESTQFSRDRKGKGRAIEPEEEEADLTEYDARERARLEALQAQEYEQVVNGEDEEVNGGSYPPQGEDEVEERRVNETLKRWEEQERERRKALRDSHRTSFSNSRTSLVEDLSRRTSKMLNNPFASNPYSNPTRRSSLRKGATRLNDDDDSTPPSRRTSAGTTSTGKRKDTLEIHEEHPRSTSPSSPSPLITNNPFSTPRAGSPASLLEERPGSGMEYATRATSPRPGDGLIEGTSEPPTPSPGQDGFAVGGFEKRPAILQAQDSTYALDTLSKQKERPKSSLPPPKPLDLPEGVKVDELRVSGGNVVINEPRGNGMRLERGMSVEQLEEREAEERRKDGRWWTDWLCGCSERGVEQAGKTNPFE